MSDNAPKLQHELIGAVAETDVNFYKKNPHPGARWFDRGNVGLFIHNGISTVRSDIDLSWGMIANKPWEKRLNVDYTITPTEYFALASRYNPINYNPEKWIQAIFRAGMTYAVIVTKHHDGFALWQTKFGDYHIDKSVQGGDLIKPFVEACRKYGIKIGLYYSPPDWYYNREYMSFNYGSDSNFVGQGASVQYDVNHNPTKIKKKPAGWDLEFKKYIRGQIVELLTLYGDIDMLWFDGGQEYKDAITLKEIRAIQPHIVINPRFHGEGDFYTFEVTGPKEKPKWEVWEHEVIWQKGVWWANMINANGYHSVEWLTDIINKNRGMGGNTLINVGPQADGTLPKEVYEKLGRLISN